jgi:hypothetical protein
MLTGVWPANVIEGPHWWKSLFRFRKSDGILIFWAPATCLRRRHRVFWYNLFAGKPAKRISPSPPGAGLVLKEGFAQSEAFLFMVRGIFGRGLKFSAPTPFTFFTLPAFIGLLTNETCQNLVGDNTNKGEVTAKIHEI